MLSVLKRVCPCISLAGAIVAAVALGWLSYQYGAPDDMQPDEAFELQFGRGSGWHGLDLFRVTSDGKASYEYQAEFGGWQRKRFALDEPQMTRLRAALTDLKVWEMERAYTSPGIADGTQWCLLVRMDGRSKAVYFDNNFPPGIRKFADFVDEAILEPLADPLAPQVVPARHQLKHQKVIWQSIR